MMAIELVISRAPHEAQAGFAWPEDFFDESELDEAACVVIARPGWSRAGDLLQFASRQSVRASAERLQDDDSERMVRDLVRLRV
jgi:hypothetical protein